jgi:hypothetical protein
MIEAKTGFNSGCTHLILILQVLWNLKKAHSLFCEFKKFVPLPPSILAWLPYDVSGAGSV